MLVTYASLRAWLLPATAFLLMIGYLPGVVSVSTAGRWGLITLVGLPALLTLGTPRGVANISCAIALFWVGLSFLWTVSPLDTAESLLHWLALLGIGVLASRTDARGRTEVAIALGVSVSLPFVILQALGFAPVWSLVSVGFPGRAGLFLTDNVLAEVATVASILMLVRRRWVLAVAPALCAIISGRSEVLLMLIAAGIVLPNTRRAVLYLVLWLVSSILTIIYMDQVATYPESVLVRLQIWDVTVQNLSILGAGLGTFGTLLPNYGFAHNEPLQLMFELGIGSVPVFGVVTYAFLRAPHRDSKLPLGALVASGLVWSPLQDPSTSFLFVFLVGNLLGDIRRLSWVEALQRAYNVRGAPRPRSQSSGKVRAASVCGQTLAARSQLAQ
jgi:hypothetical protein